MSIILNVDDLLEAAGQLEIDGQPVIDAVEALAQQLADAECVTLHDVSYQPGFGGLCATFKPGDDGNTSDVLAAGDPGGEWCD